MNRQPTFFTLSNGLRVVHIHLPGATVAHVGVAVRAGSRDELTEDEFGIAHFVEHTIFKGTRRRSSWHIINRMEAIGGELNAFTTKEDTVIYSTFPKSGLSRALDLMADLVCNSRFPSAELDRERQVVCDEIDSYLDQPADAVYDDFEDILYAGTPLGHNILGTEQSVKVLDGERCRRWLDRYYVASNMVAFYLGPTCAEMFRRRAETTLGAVSGDVSSPKRITTVSVDVPQFAINRKIDSHQSHTVMGARMPRLEEQDRAALALLTNILGGPGMNSILNIELRERRGLVYNVESTATLWSDTTMFTTYFGTDADDTGLCVRLVTDAIKRMADAPMTARRLAAAKKQYIGQLVLARDNNENHIISIARTLLSRGNSFDPYHTDELIKGLTADDLVTAARRLTTLSRLTLEPR